MGLNKVFGEAGEGCVQKYKNKMMNSGKIQDGDLE